MLASTPEGEHRSVGMCGAIPVEQTAQVPTQHAPASPCYVGNTLLYAHMFQLPGETHAGKGQTVQPLRLVFRYSGLVGDMAESLRQGQQLRQQDLFVLRDKEAHPLSLVDGAVRRHTSQPFA